jgi:pimeloyl-ACP methyl ester carboxylesterase
MRCELANLSVHYEQYGEGRPLLVLHGTGGNHTVMEAVMEPLFAHRSGWRRIYPDLPGMGGQTPGPDWMTTTAQMIDVILAFVDAVIPGERFVVGGLSYGGLIARRVAQRRSALLDGIFLLVPAVGGSTPPKQTLVRDPAFVAAMQKIAVQHGLEQELEGAIDMAVVQSPAFAAATEALVGSTHPVDKALIERLFQAPESTPESSPDYVDQPFPGPALIVTGRQDHVCGYQAAWDLLEVYPRATFAVLDRGGHILWVEQQTLVTALIGEWLDRVQEYAVL